MWILLRGGRGVVGEGAVRVQGCGVGYCGRPQEKEATLDLCQRARQQ